ncbi:hypothetical protein J8N05_18640 [Streptomyces sp. BH-SS-21]|uniref:Uncharacterized protein n=1 Tax=Streptomyces liliiviolaceus TaxID=2823109 RepID=A0A940XU43_9ACTN|nr:hypothetical protein [Streptomyces liliiviolaceus]MBQ0850216.1 hypothetical protein [Streptomyces liliiviolaceus]
MRRRGYRRRRTASEPGDRRLPEVLTHEARALTGPVAGRPAPPVVLLARARRAFAVAGLVSTVLADHASPAREGYGLGVVLADEACAVLDPVVDPELIAAYRADLRRGEAGQLVQLAELDLTFHARVGEPVIDDAMVTLAAALCDVLNRVVANERALPGQRSAARAVAD